MSTLFSEAMAVSNPQECQFYHTLELPVSGVQRGQWDLRGRFEDYTLAMPMKGKTMLDVGTASGFLTFEAEKRGARVVSVDAASAARWERLPFAQNLPYIDRAAWDTHANHHLDAVKRSYWLAHRELGSEARVFYGDAYDIPDSLGIFDVVVVGQILVHLRDVIRAMTSITRRCGNTLIIAEGMDLSEEPISRFYGRAHNPERDHSFWRHSVGLFRELLAMLGFRLDMQGTKDYVCNVEGHPSTIPITTLVFTRVGPGLVDTRIPPPDVPVAAARSPYGVGTAWRRLKGRLRLDQT
jgi:SAM-dependent methyltransferase